MMFWTATNKTWQPMRSTSGSLSWGTRTVYCRIHQASDGQEQDHMIDDLSGDERRWAADKRDFVADCRDDIADERDAKPTRGTHGG